MYIRTILESASEIIAFILKDYCTRENHQLNITIIKLSTIGRPTAFRQSIQDNIGMDKTHFSA